MVRTARHRAASRVVVVRIGKANASTVRVNSPSQSRSGRRGAFPDVREIDLRTGVEFMVIHNEADMSKFREG
jgi:hypothetical protein